MQSDLKEKRWNVLIVDQKRFTTWKAEAIATPKRRRFALSLTKIPFNSDLICYLVKGRWLCINPFDMFTLKLIKGWSEETGGNKWLQTKESRAMINLAINLSEVSLSYWRPNDMLIILWVSKCKTILMNIKRKPCYLWSLSSHLILLVGR